MQQYHGTLKNQLQEIKKGGACIPSPQNSLDHTLFVLNVLTFDDKGPSAVESLWYPTTQHTYTHMKWKGQLTGIYILIQY